MAHLGCAPSVRVMRRSLQLPLLTLSVACGRETPQQSTEVTAQTEETRALEEDSSARESAKPALIPPPRRRSILGVFGFTARSNIQFEALPDSPHQLSATYAFPDRARWYIEPANAKRGQRSVRYRSGPQAWELPPGSGEAAQYQGEQATQALLQLELRRAAMLFPHGLDWSVSEEAAGALHKAGLVTGGHLSARSSAADVPPSSFFSHLSDGSSFEELRDVEWTDGPFGPRPSRWKLISGGTAVWTESIENVDTKVRFVDSHFLPPHLRELPSRGGAEPILLVEVPSRLRRRRSVAARTWEAALEEAKGVIRSTVPAISSASVDPSPVFELGPDGLPRALLIRLISGGDTAPEGWEEAHGESALSRLSPNGELPTSASIQELMDARPEGTASGQPRLRVTFSVGGVETTQLLLPLSPSALGD